MGHMIPEPSMDETTRSIIDGITQRFESPRDVGGGKMSTLYFDTLSLSPNDCARLAAQAIGHLDEHAFDLAVGIAYKGVLFGAAIAGGKQVAILTADGALVGPPVKDRRVVVVDDIVCSGSRILAASDVVKRAGGEVIGLACIVDRSGREDTLGAFPLWSAAQFPLECG